MKTRMVALLSVLTIALVAYLFYVPAPDPISKLEKTELAKKIEWSGHGNILSGTFPIVEIPRENPFFRIVRVFSSGTSENGYLFKENHLAVDLGCLRSIDMGSVIRDHYRARREKILQ